VKLKLSRGRQNVNVHETGASLLEATKKGWPGGLVPSLRHAPNRIVADEVDVIPNPARKVLVSTQVPRGGVNELKSMLTVPLIGQSCPKTRPVVPANTAIPSSA
jgi:hypothetical protein